MTSPKQSARGHYHFLISEGEVEWFSTPRKCLGGVWLIGCFLPEINWLVIGSMNTVKCTSLDISQMAQMFMAQGQPALGQTSMESPDKDISEYLSY